MRFYCLADVENQPLPGWLFRKRVEGKLIYEEVWDFGNQEWIPTTYLTKLMIGGDCSLLEITGESANKILQNSE